MGRGNYFDIDNGTNDYTDINFTIAPGSKHYLYIGVRYSDSVTSQPKNLSANIKLELTYEQAWLDSNGIAVPPITGTVYRWTTDSLSIGDSIEGVEITTDPSTLNKNYYLKHDVVNNIITASYACFVTDTEHCVRGGDSSYYETNKALLQSQESWFIGNGGYCQSFDNSLFCNLTGDPHIVYVNSDGSVSSSYTSESTDCHVDSSGDAYCYVIPN